MAADADAFVWAAARSKLAEVELYLANAGDVNAKHSETGMTALSCATCHGHVAVAKLILDKDAAAVEGRNGDGNTALHDAAQVGHPAQYHLPHFADHGTFQVSQKGFPCQTTR